MAQAGKAARIAWALWVLAVALLPAGPLWVSLDWTGSDAIPFLIGLVSVQLATATAGAVIASRLPKNAVGWIFLALGTGLGIALASGAWATFGLDEHHGPLPGDGVAAWIVTWLFLPVVFGLPLFLLLLFPDGRFVSRRWRRVGVTVGAFLAFSCVVAALLPGDNDLRNPLAPGGWLRDVLEVLDVVTSVLALPTFAVAVAGMGARFRRSRGVERQQLKWFTYAAALACASFASSLFVPGGAADWLFLAGLLALAGLPIAAGIAILRHRLYDIDVVINRTLVYAALTATLAGAYVGSVLLLQLGLSPLTEQSDLAIAGSTLAVAALFRPARHRIQELVDRRFYRRKYDTGRTLTAFGARLREQVELDSLREELRAVVAQTLQPAHVTLWLRAPK